LFTVIVVLAAAALWGAGVRGADGGLDGTFNPGGTGADSEVFALAVQTDGKIIVGGSFATYNGTNIRFLARLNTDGTRDLSFNPGGAGPDGPVDGIAIQPDGKILIGGAFTSYNGDPAASDRIMRLNADGTRDLTFNPGGTGAAGGNFVDAITVQIDGTILIGGFFTTYNDDPAANDNIMRLKQDGTRDAAFNAGGTGANSGVHGIAVQPDGKIVIVGLFNAYNGDASVSDDVMRLNADGTRDATFNPGGAGAAARTRTVAVLTDGKILIGGDFFAYNGDGNVPHNMMRLNTDGTRDQTFNPGGAGPSGPVFSLVIQSNGKIVIGGGFTAYNGDEAASDRVMRLNTDGSRDPSFNAGGTGANTPVEAVALQPDRKIIIAGLCTSYNGDDSAPDRIMRLMPEAANSTLSFSQPAYVVGEGDGSIVITVNRLGDSSSAATVEYATSDGGVSCANSVHLASAKCDFNSALGKLNFAPGDQSRTFVVLINQDSFVEGPETFTVALFNPTGVDLLGSSAVVTINDDVTEPSGNVIDDARNFVRQHYHDFLNREPDQSGWDFWTNQITSCGTDAQCNEVRRVDVSASFFLSIEFQQSGYLVERFYKVAYGDALGNSTFQTNHQLAVPVVRLNEFLKDTQRIGQGVIVLQPGWEQALEANKQAYALEFVQTARFTAALPASLTPTQFVTRLNQNAGGVLSANEQTMAINLFGNAGDSSSVTARAQAVRMVAEDTDLYNAEFNRAFVLAEYFGYLRRNPNDPQDTDYTGYDFWLTKLNQFNGNYVNAEMVKAFLSSIEYRRRFGP
jgi:uncharacterized delta-60 repeat protein